MIQAIETVYKGYKFRSRLEARWAVFFDALKINWIYEAEGYQTKDGSDKYLPDFYFPPYTGKQGGLFAEVKGDPYEMQRDYQRYVRLLDCGGVLPLFANSYYNKTDTYGLILLGEIPFLEKCHAAFHPIVQHGSGLRKRWGSFDSYGFRVEPEGELSILNGLNTEHSLGVEPYKWSMKAIIAPTLGYRPYVIDAYTAARHARFEHGKKP
jgi:hypothetical protein